FGAATHRESMTLGIVRGVARVIVVGSANVDLVWHGPRLPRPGETVSDGEFRRVFGGKGANQASAGARLDASTAFVGCVGDDDLGNAVRSDLEARGIDCSWLATAPEPTSRGDHGRRRRRERNR